MMSKKEKKRASVKIGMVNYINTAPIYEIWKREYGSMGYTVVEAPPAALNKMLAAGDIDMGFVSSYEYCVRPQKYRILRDLSISSNGPVGSVFLFSRCPLEQLEHKVVLLSNQSETSVRLVKIILEDFYHLQPEYAVGSVSGELDGEYQAVLAIGDDALRLVSDGEYAYHYDLGQIWFEKTGLPFVFSVCVVREDFCLKSPELTQEVRQSLVKSREKGQGELAEICRLAAPRIPMDVKKCLSYLEALEYDLGEEKCRALELFLQHLIDRGEGIKDGLPLKFFPE